MRMCGECSVCCVVGAVPELDKPPHTPCKYIKTDVCGSCGIFDQKELLPKVCSQFMCAWKHEFGNEDERPDKIGVMFSINSLEGSSGHFLVAIETEPNALIARGKRFAIEFVKAINIPMIVSKYGSKPPHDTGDSVIIPQNIFHRCKLLAGEKILDLDDEVAMYKLIRHTPTFTYSSSNGSSNSSI